MHSITRTDRAHQGKIIPSNRVRIAAPTVESVAEPHADDHQPKITLVKDGATVKAIVIECPCGQTTRLECEY